MPATPDIGNFQASLPNDRGTSASLGESLNTNEPLNNDKGDSIEAPSNDLSKSLIPKPRNDFTIEDNKTLDRSQIGDENLFFKYYSIEESIDEMTSADAKLILRNFKHNIWSGK